MDAASIKLVFFKMENPNLLTRNSTVWGQKQPREWGMLLD